MLVSDFDYHLPEELIAQRPVERREDSRLMLVDRERQKIEHHSFTDLPELLGRDVLMVVNDTLVFPARLFGHHPGKKESIEVLLVRDLGEGLWEALARPGKKVRVGDRLVFGTGQLKARAISAQGRTRLLKFSSHRPFWEMVEELGEVPLPPYIRRPEGPNSWDRRRYQTVFASRRGSVAAPTAGLHFSPRLLQQIPHCKITLHVGYGTFKPVTSDAVQEHSVDAEFYEIRPQAARRINRAREEKKRVVAVGTTTTRALESAVDQGSVKAGSDWTGLFIYPGFEFQVVQGLITNFHLPRSSLLMLVSAFAGRELVLAAYRKAVQEKYRFYSYGDAMLIV